MKYDRQGPIECPAHNRYGRNGRDNIPKIDFLKKTQIGRTSNPIDPLLMILGLPLSLPQ